jgi:hypothetical protein
MHLERVTISHRTARPCDLWEATATWVHSHYNHRLMQRLGRIPPLEYEDLYHAKQRDGQPAARTQPSVHETRDGS